MNKIDSRLQLQQQTQIKTRFTNKQKGENSTRQTINENVGDYQKARGLSRVNPHYGLAVEREKGRKKRVRGERETCIFNT